jgi:hypothetical protein
MQKRSIAYNRLTPQRGPSPAKKKFQLALEAWTLVESAAGRRELRR